MTTIVDAPARVDDLQLIGAMVGSGFRTPPSLVRRSDGQTLQLTPLLYRVLEAIDGRRTCAEIATVVSHSMRRSVSEDMVATLVDQHLRPMGLLKLADGSEPPLKRSNPLLALKLKFAVTNPRATRRLTDPFRFLFRPALVSIVVLGFLAITWWVFFDQGLAPAAYDAFQRPHLLLLVFVVTVLSGGFHEFGHAAAARYSGANPGVIGAGIYLVWPAFYTDVTDSYRLGRRGRLRTDLGGLYFNAIVVVLTFAWWYTTQWDALLLLVATQVMQMVHQLMPLLRFDGYHVLADLTGVPDLYHRIKPTLLGLLPHRWFHPEQPGPEAVGPRGDHRVGAGHDPDDGAHAAGAGVCRAATARYRVGRRAAGRRRSACRVAARGTRRRHRPGAPGAGCGAARDGGFPHHGTHRAAVVPRTRTLEPHVGPQADRRRDAQRCRPDDALLGLVAATGHVPADPAQREEG